DFSPTQQFKACSCGRYPPIPLQRRLRFEGARASLSHLTARINHFCSLPAKLGRMRREAAFLPSTSKSTAGRLANVGSVKGRAIFVHPRAYSTENADRLRRDRAIGLWADIDQI